MTTRQCIASFYAMTALAFLVLQATPVIGETMATLETAVDLSVWADSYRHVAEGTPPLNLAGIGGHLVFLAGLSFCLARALPHNRRRVRRRQGQVAPAARAISRRR